MYTCKCELESDVNVNMCDVHVDMCDVNVNTCHANCR